MNIETLIKILSMYPPDTEVLAFDEGVSTIVPVTGLVYDGRDKLIEITTDDPS